MNHSLYHYPSHLPTLADIRRATERVPKFSQPKKRRARRQRWAAGDRHAFRQ